MLPIKLSGNSLGERQAILNKKVEEALKNNIDFMEVEELEEGSDIDRLFKIDLANKYKNIEYILKTLKSGDSLYVSRALKCTWLFTNSEYFDIINPTYLQNNVFPQMSEKCMKKFFARIVSNVNEERAKLFYDYCLMTNRYIVAAKFLTHCSHAVKRAAMMNSRGLVEPDKCKKIFGNSFELIHLLLGKDNCYINSSWEILYECRDLYNTSNEKYLDMIESYVKTDKFLYSAMYFPKFGNKLSKNILSKHKSRVLRKATIYLHILHRKTLLSNINKEEAKIIAANKFESINKYWSFYAIHMGPFLKFIDPDLKFQFIKDEFKKQFPKEEFEFSKKFSENNYQQFMTPKQKEEWALTNLEREQSFGSDETIRWYRHINFDTTFKVLKELIHKETRKERRFELLAIIAEATTKMGDIEQLLKYFTERHMNEDASKKILFLEHIITVHCYKVVQFCWTLFDELFHSVGLYKKPDSYSELQKCALVYHILNNKKPPRSLVKAGLNEFNISHLQLGDKEKEAIFEYMLRCFEKEAKKVEKEEDNFKRILKGILNLLKAFNKYILDYPAVVDMVKPHAATFWHYHILPITKNDPRKVRPILFKDAIPCDLTEEMVLSVIKENAQNLDKYMPAVHDSRVKTSRLYSKLRVYFPDDLKQTLCRRYINQIRSRDGEIVSLFSVQRIVQHYIMLETPEKSKELMLHFVPKSAKIDHSKADGRALALQQGICKGLHLPRPPLPLDLVMSFVKGDYVQYCRHSLDSLCVTMPHVRVTEFIKLLIESPVSVQKHGLRLAFQKMTADELYALVTNIWATTKNVSIRKLLFVSVQNQVWASDSDLLVPVLKRIISELNEDDGQDTLKRLTNYTHQYNKNIRGGIISAIWATINKLPNNNFVWEEKRLIVIDMCYHFELMDDHFLTEVISKYINDRFLRRGILNPLEGSQKLYNESMLNLLAKYLVCCNVEVMAVRMQLFNTIILTNLFAMWNESISGFYAARIVLKELVDNLIEISREGLFESTALPHIMYATPRPLFELLLTEIETKSSLVDNVRVVFDIRLIIALLNCVHFLKTISLLNDENRVRRLTEVFFKFAERFGNELAVQLLSMIEKKHYFHSLLFPVADIIKSFVYTIEMERYFSNLPFELCPRFMIYAAKGLLLSRNAHLFAVALEILPDDCPDGSDEAYARVVSEIKRLENDEIRCLYHMKFGSDHKRRKYI